MGEFNRWELYWAGLIPSTEVPNTIIFDDQSQPLYVGAVLKGPYKEYTPSDVINYDGGEREPTYPNTQHSFNGIWVVTSDRPLYPAEIAYSNFLPAYYSSHSDPLPGPIDVPFYYATKQHGSMDHRIRSLRQEPIATIFADNRAYPDTSKYSLIYNFYNPTELERTGDYIVKYSQIEGSNSQNISAWSIHKKGRIILRPGEFVSIKDILPEAIKNGGRGPCWRIQIDFYEPLTSDLFSYKERKLLSKRYVWFYYE